MTDSSGFSLEINSLPQSMDSIRSSGPRSSQGPNSFATVGPLQSNPIERHQDPPDQAAERHQDSPDQAAEPHQDPPDQAESQPPDSTDRFKSGDFNKSRNARRAEANGKPTHTDIVIVPKVKLEKESKQQSGHKNESSDAPSSLQSNPPELSHLSYADPLDENLNAGSFYPPTKDFAVSAQDSFISEEVPNTDSQAPVPDVSGQYSRNGPTSITGQQQQATDYPTLSSLKGPFVYVRQPDHTTVTKDFAVSAQDSFISEEVPNTDSQDSNLDQPQDVAADSSNDANSQTISTQTSFQEVDSGRAQAVTKPTPDNHLGPLSSELKSLSLSLPSMTSDPPSSLEIDQAPVPDVSGQYSRNGPTSITGQQQQATDYPTLSSLKGPFVYVRQPDHTTVKVTLPPPEQTTQGDNLPVTYDQRRPNTTSSALKVAGNANDPLSEFKGGIQRCIEELPEANGGMIWRILNAQVFTGETAEQLKHALRGMKTPKLSESKPSAPESDVPKPAESEEAEKEQGAAGGSKPLSDIDESE
ncbi:uncharacterized protein [Watersipora subatra]|uniref:uncharacterized protein n=1 Tax=Watersipora subatra TaxID=2589382 RepID=UPI00355BDC30